MLEIIVLRLILEHKILLISSSAPCRRLIILVCWVVSSTWIVMIRFLGGLRVTQMKTNAHYRFTGRTGCLTHGRYHLFTTLKLHSRIYSINSNWVDHLFLFMAMKKKGVDGSGYKVRMSGVIAVSELNPEILKSSVQSFKHSVFSCLLLTAFESFI
jgi:hypothetical protein